MPIPEFWKTRISDIEETFKMVKKGSVKKLCLSAGNRDISYVEYGEKEDFNKTANYNSACGARDESCYADKSGKKPVIMFVGAIHGHELEGTLSINNLIKIFETGTDYKGDTHPYFTDLIEKNAFRIILIPLMNPDGRERMEIQSIVGLSTEQMHYYGQGTWKDKQPCNWPGCKRIHPIKDAVDFMGAYFNDDGINLMHDNFFMPFAEETKALMKLVDDEAPDFILLLHGFENERSQFLYTSFVPNKVNEKINTIAVAAKSKCDQQGVNFTAPSFVKDAEPRFINSFNLTSALHHICGGISATFESYQGMKNPPEEASYEVYENILKCHYIIFEEIFREYEAI